MINILIIQLQYINLLIGYITGYIIGNLFLWWIIFFYFIKWVKTT